MAIMFVTHDLGVIAEMAEDVIVMYLGKVVERADVQTLFADPKHPYTQALMQSVPRLTDERRTHLSVIEGMAPDPSDIPPGCPFHPRCPQAMPDVCDVQTPSETVMGEGHGVACLLYEGHS